MKKILFAICLMVVAISCSSVNENRNPNMGIKTYGGCSIENGRYFIGDKEVTEQEYNKYMKEHRPHGSPEPKYMKKAIKHCS